MLPDEESSSRKEHLINLLEISGGLVFGVLAWALSDAGFHKWSFFIGFLAICSGLAIMAHYLEKLGVKFVKCGLVLVLVLTGILFSFFIFHKPEIKTEAPLVMPNRIQLASSDSTIRNAVTVFNPYDFPIFNVVVQVETGQTNIPASSIDIDPGKAFSSETNFGDIPGDFVRINLSSKSVSHPTKRYPESILLKFGVIPAKQGRGIRISGSIKTNSWADLSVLEYDKNLSLPNWNTNFTVVGFPFPNLKGIKGFEFPLTNIPYGGILLTNGMPAFTNLPHLCIGLDLSEFGGSNFLKLTDSSPSLSNNLMRPWDITNLLTLPIDKSSSNAAIKFVLLNDTGVDVSNIDLIFNSAMPFNFLSNGVWVSASEVPTSRSNNVANMIKWIACGKLDRLSPGVAIYGWPRLSFETTNVENLNTIGIALNAKDMPQQLIGFWLMLGRTNSDSHSLITPTCEFSGVFPEISTNGLKFRFPPLKLEFK